MVAGEKQTGGGQFARVSEFSGLEYENSRARDIRLQGYMIFVTRHHNAKRSTNQEFNVVRFLCVRGGQVVYKYLGYIRRFLEMLRRKQSSFRFLSEETPDKPWDSSRYTSILKKATTEVWKNPG